MRISIILAILLFLFTQNISAQKYTVTGTVSEIASEETLPGVVVCSSENPNIGAVTDMGGNFEIELPENTTALCFTCIGFQKKIVPVHPGIPNLVIEMKPSDNGLDEVIVTGYTSQSKNKIAGSISSLDSKNVELAPVASIDQALQGRIPGLYVASASGLPGTPGRVTIRGIGSLQGGNTNPLYIVDGVPIEPASFAALNPEDFESISVLKDAASSAQYGSRAANGVIVITTKKGQTSVNGKPIVNYLGQVGFSKVNNYKWDMMNSEQRLQFEEILQDPTYPGWLYSRNNKYNADGSMKTSEDYAYGDSYLNNLKNADNNLRKKVLRTALNQSHNLSILGGSKTITYYLSGGYYQQDGVLQNSGIKRYNLRSNIQYSSSRWKVGLNIGLGYANAKVTEGDFDVSETNPIAALYLSLPYEKLYNQDGSLATGTNKYGANALSMFNDINRSVGQIKSTVSTNISYQLTEELKLTGVAGMDFQQFHNTCYIRPDSYLGGLVDPGEQGSYEDQYVNKVGFIATGGATYKKKWSGVHELEGNLLAEVNENKYNSSGYVGYGLVPGIENTPAGITPGTSGNSFIPTINGNRSNNVLLSQIALFRYSYANKYTLTASARNDNSSQAPRANRNKMFYAFGGNWDISKEEYLENSKFINILRLRLSYGRTGNASGFASDFGYRGLYGASNYGGMSALIPVYPANPHYNWELNYMGNVGLDFELFNSRLSGGLDVYNRITSGLFVEKRLSYTSGFESIATNAGKVRNRGIEFYVGSEIINLKDFSLSLGLNIAYNQNRIIDLGSEDEFITEEYSINRVGLPIGQFYMVRWGGVDPATGAPMYLDADGEITYTYNPDDAVLVKGSFDPPTKGGFTLDARYKQFELSALFSFIKGMYRLNTAQFFKTSADANYRQYNQSVDMLNIWQKPGDITDHPAASYPRYMTDRELQNADYVKLRNVIFSYRYPLSPNTKRNIQELRFFAQGQNLITWTKFKAFDPEDDNNWYQYEYPMPLTITAGVSITF